MDSDQPRANTSATLDPDTILGGQTQPNTSDSPMPSNSTDSTLPTNNSLDSSISTDSLDSPSVVVSPDSSSPDTQLSSNSGISSPDSSSPDTQLSSNSATVNSDSPPSVRPGQYFDVKPLDQPKSLDKPDKLFHFNKTAVLATLTALSVIVAAGIGSLVLTSSNGNNASLTGNNKPISTNYKPQSLNVSSITGYDQLLTGKNQSLRVNGKLSVASSIVLSPTTTPSNPTLGQLYYNASTNTPYLYNGKSFISLIPSVGGTIAGASTSLSLGSGLGLQGSNLVSTGVTALSGTPNQIIASASNGSIKLSLPTNLDIAGNFTTTNGLVTNSLDAGYISGNGYGITNINPNALPSTLAYQNKNNTFTSPQKFRNTTNSTDSFSIQDAAGNTLLSADTTTDTLTVNNLLPEDPGMSVQGVTQNSIIADSGNDGYNDNGQWSVMGSDGFMRFVYTNWTTDTIHYVRCENTDCTTYIDQPIETDATNDLDSPTIALDQNGDPYIAYIDYTSPTNSWHIAHCSDENCSTTTIEDLTQTAAYGYNGSIAVDGQGNADLVYDTYDYSSSPQTDSLEFIHCDNTDCSLNTDTTLASSNSNNGGSGYETSSVVTAPDGYPRVAYVNEGTDSLVYDNCSGSYDCSSYTSNVVDNGNASYWMAMAVGSDGLAKFVYEGSGNPNYDALEYAACSDAACSTASKTQLVSGTNSEGGYGSIALTSSNLPVISIYTKPNGQAADLLYIYCSDADCTTPLTKTVASLGTEGYTSNIGITSNGLPMITYIYQDNGSDASINSVTLGDITGGNITTGTNIGSSSDPFGTIYASQIQTTGINTSSSGQLLIQGTTDSTNAFTVQDAEGGDLLNVNSLTGTTTLSTATPTYLGADLITDSEYGDGSWSGNNWTFSDDSATYSGSGGDELTDNGISFTTGDIYQITFTVSGDTNGGCIAPAIGDTNGGCYNNDGTYTSDITANDSSLLTFIPYYTPFNGTISNVSIEQTINTPVLQIGTTFDNTALSVDSAGDLTTDGTVTLNNLAQSSSGTSALCLNSENQLATCNSLIIGAYNYTYAPGTHTGTYPSGVAISGDYAYVVNYNSSTLQVFDISNPANPSEVANVGTDSSPQDVTVSGDYAYVVNYNSSTLQVFDISNPANPSEVADVPTDSSPYAVTISGNYAYVTDTYGNFLQVFDISNPTNPIVVSDSSIGNNGYVLAISGNYAYVGGFTTLQVFDISNPTNPTLIASVNDNWATGITILGNYAYVSSLNGGAIEVFDISDPSNPTPIGGNNGSDRSSSIAVYGNYAYVGSEGDTLQVFNISDPSNPTQVANVETGGGNVKVAINGNYVYAINPGGNTLQVFDISNPASPTLVNGDALYVNGTTDIQSTNDTSSAFSVQDAEGNTLLDVDTLDSVLSVDTNTTTFQTPTGSTTAFQVQNSNDNDVLDVDTQDNWVGIDNSSPANLLSIGDLTTASTNAQVAVSTNGTTNSGIVVQTVAGQTSGYVLQAQDSSGNTLASIDYQGNLTVMAATVNGTLTVNGHIITEGSTPSIAAETAVGTGGSASVIGNDEAGKITILTGTSPTVGALVTLTFNQAYNNTPIVVLTAVDYGAGSLQYNIHPDYSSGANFIIDSGGTPSANSSYVFNYIVVGEQ